MFFTSFHRQAMRQVTGSLCLLGLVVAPVRAGDEAPSALVLTPPTKIVKTTTTVSPPALRYDAAGVLHATWVEKKGQTGEVKTAVIASGESTAGSAQSRSVGGGPEAIHQSPGFAIGSDRALYITWSVANRAPGALFASDLTLTKSPDGGTTFQSPVKVNDDGLAISHTFEDVLVGRNGDLYLSWLDGRNKDRSGAGLLFACSRDGGATMDKNLVVDGMACPCCRPMLAQAPDGSLWVAWRKTFEGNVRDIVVARSTDQGRTFSPPILVSQDGWVFDACPHRGPSIAFDGKGRLYVGWYTEGKDEQPRLFVSHSDDQGATFSQPVVLHTAATSLPDNLHLAVQRDGLVVAVWEEATGVRKRVVMRVSTDRGETFAPMQTLTGGSKAEHPVVALHEDGKVAIGWTEHAFPHNRIVVQQGRWRGAAAP